MSIETPGDQEERSTTVAGASAAVVADVPEEEQHKGGWSPRDLLKGDLGQWPVFIGLVIIAIYFQIASGGFFFYPENLSGLAYQTLSVAMIAVAAVLVLLIRDIDLSLSAVAYFCGAVMGVLSVRHGWPAAQAIVAGILVGTLIGVINGVLVAILRMPSFIVTLAGFIFYQGALSHILVPQTTLQIFDPTIDGIETYNLSTLMSMLVPAIIVALYAAAVIVGRLRRQRAKLPVQSVTQLII